MICNYMQDLFNVGGKSAQIQNTIRVSDAFGAIYLSTYSSSRMRGRLTWGLRVSGERTAAVILQSDVTYGRVSGLLTKSSLIY